MSATPPAPPPSGVLAALSPATLVGWEKRAERASKSMTADELTLDEAVALATIRTSRHIRYMWTVLAILLILSVLFGIFWYLGRPGLEHQPAELERLLPVPVALLTARPVRYRPPVQA